MNKISKYSSRFSSCGLTTGSSIKWFFLLLFLFFPLKLISGFATDTMVKVPGGYKNIDQLQPGNIVYSIAKSGDCCLTRVKRTTSYFLSGAVLIFVGDDVIVAAPQQKFYDPEKNIWRKAKVLQKSMSLLSGHKNIVTIDDIKLLDCEIEFFDIHLDDEHTFFVSTQNIVVHNFPPFFIGFSIAFGGGISFEGLYCGLCIAGWWLGTKLLKRGKDEKYNPKFSVGRSPALAGGPDPDDDEWKKKHPYGRYEESSKHHQNSQEGIGKPPRDGQAALDSSIPFGANGHRVAIQDNKFVVLRKTAEREFHAYVVENWKDVPWHAQNALYDQNLVANKTSGRIKK